MLVFVKKFFRITSVYGLHSRQASGYNHYIHIMGNTAPDNKKSTPTVKYGGHCLRYKNTLVGKNYLL